VTFLSLREELRRRCPRAEYFDLRFKGRIYAKEPLVAPVPMPVVAVPSAPPQVAVPAMPAPPGGPVAEG
jgi:hypothetical protein